MGIRSGAEYLASLADGREVWLEGQRVDVGADPRLAPFAQAVAKSYDLQRDPAYADLLTAPSPTSGEPASRAFHMPHCAGDLTRLRQMFELLERRCGGVLGRFPQYMGAVLLGLYNQRPALMEANPAHFKNLARYLEDCRERDLYLTFGFTDPPRDRALPASAMEYLHVAERRPDGIVVRGAKAVATAGPYADEFLCLTAPRPDLQPEHILYFGIPVASPGLKLVCRESFTQACEADHPLSAWYDEIDAWAIFDDVFVPADRVFLLDRVDLNEGVFRSTPPAWGYWLGLIRLLAKAETLAGLCFAVTDYLGTLQAPRSQELLADILVHLESLRTFILAAEREPVTSSIGLLMPHPLYVQLGRVTSLEQHPRVLEAVRELCGASLLMAPGQPELDNPDIGPLLRRYIGGTDERARERFKMMKLAWEYTADSFGSRQLLFEQHNAGS
ncbi:MAG TPA: 4-hydroxyphenylacetate 3-hydroxylase N-terminal domain-containing protein, partial [Chloroflexota bacterium]